MKKTNKKIFLIISIIIILLIVVYVIFLFLPSGTNRANYKNTFFCSGAAKELIEKYNIDENKIATCEVEKFSEFETEFQIVLIRYGKANDCPSGCFYSHYCALYVEGNDYPLTYTYTQPDENILTIENGYGSQASYPFSSELEHPLAQSELVRNFLNKEHNNGGPFRYCWFPEK